MGSIRALALCAIVCMAVIAGVQAQVNDKWEEARPHATTILSEDPWATEPGLPIAQEDPVLQAQYNEQQERANQGLERAAEVVNDVVPEPARVPASFRVGSAASPCASQGGKCQANNLACPGGKYYSGLCTGAANIQCCKKTGTSTRNDAATPAKEADSVCNRAGGDCKEPSAGCTGTFVSGLCPGATARCCMSAVTHTNYLKEAVSGCGPYAGLKGSPTRGNGGRDYNAVPMVGMHMTNPEKVGWSITEADNTMEIKTACAFSRMHNAAKKDGVTILIASGFRTLARQQYFYNCMITGNCNNGNLAAVPGSSNHGIGIALDLNAEGPGVYSWLKNNAQKFGFVRTVPSEDWHWEYRVGWSRAPYT